MSPPSSSQDVHRHHNPILDKGGLEDSGLLPSQSHSGGLHPLLNLVHREVDEAENGRVALDRLSDSPPNLILLDLMMPEMDGFEFLAELRNNRLRQGIPVVVVTGADLSEADHRHLNGGVERILRKSAYSRDELFEEVRALVAQYVERDPGNSETASHD